MSADEVDYAVRDDDVDRVVGERDVLDVALDELDVVDARFGGVRAGELEHLVGHVEPDRLAARADAAGGDQHVGAGAGAEVEHRLALVQVGDRGRDAAAERGVDGRLQGGVAGVVVEGCAEDLVAVLVGRSDVRPAAGDGGRCSAAAGRGALGHGGRGGGVALADALADVGVGQLSHAASSSRASGMT